MPRQRGLARRDERRELLRRTRPFRDELEDAQTAVVAAIGGDVWASIFDAGQVWQIRPD